MEALGSHGPEVATSILLVARFGDVPQWRSSAGDRFGGSPISRLPARSRSLQRAPRRDPQRRIAPPIAALPRLPNATRSVPRVSTTRGRPTPRDHLAPERGPTTGKPTAPESRSRASHEALTSGVRRAAAAPTRSAAKARRVGSLRRRYEPEPRGQEPVLVVGCGGTGEAKGGTAKPIRSGQRFDISPDMPTAFNEVPGCYRPKRKWHVSSAAMLMLLECSEEKLDRYVRRIAAADTSEEGFERLIREARATRDQGAEGQVPAGEGEAGRGPAE